MTLISYRALMLATLVIPVSACTVSLKGDPVAGLEDDPATYVAFADLSSKATTTLTGVAVDSSARTATTLSGTLNRSADTATVGTADGSINANRTLITLTSGGTIALDPAGNTYSARYDAQPTVGNRTFGVVGEATATRDMPMSGTATFNGASKVTIQDGVNLYDLTGDSKVDVNFQSGNVDTTISNLNGTVQGGFGPAAAANNVTTLTLNGASVSGNTFSGGRAAITGGTLTPLSGSETTANEGVFYGPLAAETGGGFVVNDARSSKVIIGDFIAKK